MGLGVVHAAALALLALPVGAGGVAPGDEPYVALKEFISPVSGQKFSAYVIKQNVGAQSFDYDNCPHPPINTLSYTLVIDPVSGYVALPEQFNGPTALDTAAVKQVLGEPKFKRSTPEGMPWAGAYAWEKFENAARLAEALHRPESEVAGFWVYAAWSVRLDVVSGSNEFDQEVARIIGSLPRRQADPANLYTLYEMQLVDYWQEQRLHGALNDIPAADYDLALAWLYRSRGELVAAKAWVQSAASAGALSRDSELLRKYLASSIELERSYMLEAIPRMKKAWDASEYPAAQEGSAAFMLAEINRRLGDFAAAKRWYEQARAANRGGISPALIDRQLKLVDGGRGY